VRDLDFLRRRLNVTVNAVEVVGEIIVGPVGLEPTTWAKIAGTLRRHGPSLRRRRR
jgi:hypothetical protein